MKSWMACAGLCPTPGPRDGAGGNFSKFTVGDGARSAPATMRAEASSSSDADGAGGHTGVAAPAPLPVLPPEQEEAAESDGREHPQPQTRLWVLQVM